MKSIQNFNDWSDITEHQKLGEILLQAGMLNLVHLGMALDIQRFQDIRLGEILIDMKIITQDELNDALDIQKQIDAKLRG